MDFTEMIENLNVAIVACYADFNTIYSNPKCT
jgi:hypothetical protein